MDLPLLTILLLGVIGLFAGALGGALGAGGSVIMIPAMAILVGKEHGGSQHLYQAGAMVVNIAVAVPAALKHRAKGRLRMDVVRWMMPVALVAIVVGVLVSNQFRGADLRRIFGVFLAVMMVSEGIALVGDVRGRHEEEKRNERVTPARAGLVGSVMGLSAGLLGIGGGALAVPVARRVMGIALVEAIAASSLVMVATSSVGAALKVGTLGEHGIVWWRAFVLAAILAPGGVVGARLGAGLAHAAPRWALRALLVVVLGVTVWGMWR
ncbi:MAG: sulfite exporter TauE/SafE family protein [Phycisphaerales bacterium]